MQPLTKVDVQLIVARELGAIEHAAAREWLAARMVEPEPIELFFEYGDNERFEAWIIADVRERNVVIEYCDAGFGGFGSDKWGLNFRGDRHFGMDAGWYRDLESIAFEWIGAPEGYEVP